MTLSKKDTRTVAVMIGEKANQMYKTGGQWKQGSKTLSCVDIGKIANKILQSVSPNEKFVFKWEKKPGK